MAQQETLSERLGISEETIADIGGEKYQTGLDFTDTEKALLDPRVQIGIDANRVSKDLWDDPQAPHRPTDRRGGGGDPRLHHDQQIRRHPGRGIGAGVQRHQADPVPVVTTRNQTRTQIQI